MTNETWMASYQNEVYDAGRHWEDGSQLFGERFDVYVENLKGERFVHKVAFVSPERATFAGCKAQAEKLVLRINNAILAGKWAGPRGNENWSEGRPAYVSSGQEEADCAWEREQG